MSAFSVIGTLIMLSLQTVAVTKAPKDFALRLEYGCAGREIIDTAGSIYAISYGRDYESVSVRVPGKFKDEIFRLLNEARFFEMGPRVSALGICEPSTNYRLQVRANGKTHIVSWAQCEAGVESLDPNADVADRVSALANAIVKPFNRMREVKSLRKRAMWVCL